VSRSTPGRCAAAAGALVVATGASYLATLAPGVAAGDAAELQHAAPLLGICHEPGYALEVAAGWLASRVPAGPSVAWRINAMQALFGTLGGLALFDALRTATGRLAPAALGAAILAWSSIYWSYSIVAEAYVFHAAFLLLGTAAFARFVVGRRFRFALGSAVALGVACAGRPSELLVLPGFAAAWAVASPPIRLPRLRAWLLGVAFALPFAAAVAFHLARDDPRALHRRDAALARELLGEPTPEAGLADRLLDSIAYSLGIRWVQHAARRADPARIPGDARRYAELLVGTALLAGNPVPESTRARDRGFGTSIGIGGLALALGGVLFRRRSPWVWLGAGLFAGNLAFYFGFHRWDALTFTIPGLAGLALLAGLGAAGPPEAPPGSALRRACAGLAAVAAGSLLVANFAPVDRSGASEPLGFPHATPEELAQLPPDAVLVLDYWRATTYRYLVHVEAARDDVRVLDPAPGNQARLVEALRRSGRRSFVLAAPPGASLSPRLQALRHATPPWLARYGFVEMPASPEVRRHRAREGAGGRASSRRKPLTAGRRARRGARCRGRR
jgi:hypothetical protein